jgi:hypothetical protein
VTIFSDTEFVILLPAAANEVSQVNQIEIPAGEEEKRREGDDDAA